MNNWEQIRVQDIIDAHPGDTGNLCEKKKSNGGRTLEWTCGFPKLTKVSSSAFGINLMNPDSNKKGYAKGWCKFSTAGHPVAAAPECHGQAC